jgi:photoactive yellow protein
MGMLSQAQLDALDDTALNSLAVGVIRISPTGRVERYNRTEAMRAGTQPWRVLGRDFFRELAGGEGRQFAEEVDSVPPGDHARFEHRFRGFRADQPVSIDVVRTTTGGAYLLIAPR